MVENKRNFISLQNIFQGNFMFDRICPAEEVVRGNLQSIRKLRQRLIL